MLALKKEKQLYFIMFIKEIFYSLNKIKKNKEIYIKNIKFFFHFLFFNNLKISFC